VSEAAHRLEDRLLVDGRWRDAHGDGRWSLVDPGRGEVVAEVPYGHGASAAADAIAAIDAAERAFAGWSRSPAHVRGEVLLGAADWIRARIELLARCSAEESGKPLADARAEWLSACNYLAWFAAEGARAYGRTIPARTPSRRIEVKLQPVGVVAVITAWNFPVYNVVRTVAAAMAAGCTVVVRPSELTPRSAMALAQALHESGAPPGVVNVVNGDPEPVGRVFLDDPRVRHLSFTGSPRVGKLLMDGASRTLTRLTLELGGNAPVLVFPDVDVAEVATQLASWKQRHAGQVCVAPQRLLVHEAVAGAFTEALVAATEALRVGHAFEDGVQLGPLITGRHRERVDDLVARSVAAGARTLTGGSALDRPGFFYAPTVLDEVPAGAPVLIEEVFGPVLPIRPFATLEAALREANATEYGLAAFVMTRDLNTAIVASERLEFGMVCINDWLPATPEAPFGGVKGSGLGRETGAEGLLAYLERKTVFTGGVP
jgi:succinate-semialdehyde dehydrogenase / glutarate-semialdehyde dehydrogenase